MKRMQLLPMLILATALAASSAVLLPAQSQIIAAPDAVELRKVWEREGRWGLDAEYGWRMWGGTDISGDGIADFAVYQREGEFANTWHFYRGGDPLDTAAFWRTEKIGGYPLTIGDFLDDGTLQVLSLGVYNVVIDDYSWYYDRAGLYRLHDSGMFPTPLMSIDQGEQNPPIQRNFASVSSSVAASDVNNDDVVDLIMKMSSIRVGQNRYESDKRAQIWIYYGGPGFQLDSPSVIIYDTTEDGSTPGFQYNVHLRDFDGDGLVDMMTSADYEGVGGLVRFRWGDDSSPESWTQRPFDRDIPRDGPEAGLKDQLFSPYYHLDTAPGLDFVSIVGNDDGSASALLFLSGSASIRTRSFTRADADREFILPENFNYGRATTSLNNTAYGLDMLPFDRPPWFGTPGALIFLSGGSNGPDHDYEARISEGRNCWRIGDVTGDGWEDIGGTDPQEGVLSSGVASIYSGGPYIPLDDPTLSVREVPVAGESGGLYLWPNPVDEELNIAWQGDLRQMPARFEVYDVRGVMVAEGEVEPGRGKSVWNCADLPPGLYILQCFADNGTIIASAEVIKR